MTPLKMQKIWDFHGGIHPPENKAQSLQNPIERSPLPAELVLPLSQHIGAAAKPCVEVGDTVLKGHCIAEASGLVSAPVHASSSGTISAIEDRPIPHSSGLYDRCIVIKTDGKDQWRETTLRDNWASLEPSELIDIVRQSGIAGMGGAGFPSAVKLNAYSKIDTLIINATECEPYITADHALLREHSGKIAEGIAVLSKIISPTKILIGVEDNKLDVIDKLQTAIDQWRYSDLSGQDCSIAIVTYPTKYPSGGEKQLIEILTGKQVPSGGLPADLGIICHNVGSTVAIRDAVIDDKPLISRITTFTGNAIGLNKNLEVLIGTPIRFLLKQVNFKATNSNRIIVGGPMMGFAIQNIDAPIIKTTNCILAPTEQELPTPPPAQACIRCGICAEACPASLLPQQLYWFAQGKELDKLVSHNIADCIECGACSYVCPSHIPLVQYYRGAKAEIRQRELDMQNAEASKKRFDARQARLERLEQEKIAARKARQAKAAANKAATKTNDTPTNTAENTSVEKTAPNNKKTTDPKAAAIAAAVARAKAKKAETQKNQTQTNKAKVPEQASSTDADDPIAKALAARAQQANAAPLTEQEKLQQAVKKAEERLDKAQQRLQKAEENNDANVSAFKTAVEKSQDKLNAAKQALKESAS